MAELDFRRIELSDKEKAQNALALSGFRGCEYTFGNNFVWRNVYNVEIAFLDGLYFVKFGNGEDTKFSFPSGCEIDRAIQLIGSWCDEHDISMKIYANKSITEQILSSYPETVAVYNRDSSDYIYLSEELAELKGKKFHGKRNHLNRFYENDWSFEPLTQANIEECIAMNEQWCEENISDCDACSEEEQSKRDELCVVRCSFKHYDALGYVGGVLRVNGVVQAFTFGEPSSDDCFVVHVEKALRKYQGTYTAINREFVRFLGGKYKYINREEDTGADNLRKAKLSYHPVFLEEKYDITFGGKK